MRPATIRILAALLAASPAPAAAQEVQRGERNIVEVAGQLRNGEYVWAPELSPSGTGLLIVNLQTQRAIFFRNGIPIAATTVSTGKPGKETPTGVFTVLQKRKEHYSSTYNNAPMPNMQRLTWQGIALHAGQLPGFPASHGCIRLPRAFSELLFGATSLGMTVVITNIAAAPASSASPEIAASSPSDPAVPLSRAQYVWRPELAPQTPDSMISVIVSIADSKAVVMRDGIEIGSAPVRVSGEAKPVAYVLRAWDSSGQHWLKLQFDAAAGGMEVDPGEGKRFDAPVMFKHSVATVLRPGSVVIVTPKSLRDGSTGRAQTVIEDAETAEAASE